MPERSWRCSTLFHQRSPWFLHHRRLFDEDARCCRAEEIEQRELGAGDGSEELPAGKDGGFAGARGDVRLQFGWLFAAFERGAGSAAAGQAGVDRGRAASR